MLVAHSYGGAVISNVPADAGDIVGLIYVNGFAPDSGETAFSLAGKFPGSMLGGDVVHPVPRADGTTDLYIAPERYPDLFCADVPTGQARRMAATQRPATQEALTEPAGDVARSGARCPRGSCSANATSSSRPPSTDTWPTGPVRGARSRSRMARMPSRCPGRTPS